MGYLGNTPALSYTSFAVQHFTTSATTSYTLDYSVANENEIRLVINNVVQQPGSSYAYTASGTSLTLSAATSATDTMYAVFLGKAVQTVTPANNTITNAMLSETITVANGGTGVTTASALANTGNLVLLSSQTASNDASINFDNTLITTTYDTYKVIFKNVIPSTDATNLQCQPSINNGSSFLDWHRNLQANISSHANNTTLTRHNTGTSASIVIGGGYSPGNANEENANGEMTFYNLQTDNTNKHLTFLMCYEDNITSNTVLAQGGHGCHTTSKINYLRFSFSSGNISSGQFSLYGVKT